MKILTFDENEEVIVIDEDEEIVQDENQQFTEEETNQLRTLLAQADKLLALVNNNEEEIVEDEDEEIIEDEDEEEVAPTKKNQNDSFMSIGATRKKKDSKSLQDDEEHQLSVADAWAKRMKGGN